MLAYEDLGVEWVNANYTGLQPLVMGSSCQTYRTDSCSPAWPWDSEPSGKIRGSEWSYWHWYWLCCTFIIHMNNISVVVTAMYCVSTSWLSMYRIVSVCIYLNNVTYSGCVWINMFVSNGIWFVSLRVLFEVIFASAKMWGDVYAIIVVVVPCYKD